MHKNLPAISLLLFCVSTANANLLRFEFAGEIVDTHPASGGVTPGSISGFLLIDSQVPDIAPGPDGGNYRGAIVGGGMLWDSLALEVSSTTINSLFILNDYPIYNDLFVLDATFGNPQGARVQMGLQLADSTRSVFTDDSIPTDLVLSMFDRFELDNFNGSGIFLGRSDGPWEGYYQGGLTVVEIHAVQLPDPGTVSLFVVALLAWRATYPGWRR